MAPPRKQRYRINPDTGCWDFQMFIDPKGYGRVWDGSRGRRAHIVFYEMKFGPVPEGLVLDHLCRNRACVNPDHLEPVTTGENSRRGMDHNANKTHCPQGHPYDEANTKVERRPDGSKARRCRACRRAERRRRYLERGE